MRRRPAREVAGVLGRAAVHVDLRHLSRVDTFDGQGGPSTEVDWSPSDRGMG